MARVLDGAARDANDRWSTKNTVQVVGVERGKGVEEAPPMGAVGQCGDLVRQLLVEFLDAVPCGSHAALPIVPRQRPTPGCPRRPKSSVARHRPRPATTPWPWL